MATFANKVTVIGVGDDAESLTLAARKRLAEAEVIIGGERTLRLIAPVSAETVSLGADLDAIESRLRASQGSKRTVILVAGDPLFYGVARYFIDRLGKENFEVLAHVSSMQLAFARVVESWDQAYLTDVANHPPEEIVERIRSAEKVGLFTAPNFPPPAIARDLLREGINYFRCYVCENLGTRNEVITQGTLSEIAEMDFGPLNIMILVRLADVPDQPKAKFEKKLFGNPDEAFRQSRPKRGLITPMEVRTLALAQLSLKANSVMWDIGAGSGSMSIEAGLVASSGRIYAIEPDLEDCQLLRDNAETFGVKNVQIVSGRAPEVLAELPDPDAIFLGGTGRETIGIVQVAFDRLKPGGTLVANVASLESTSALTGHLRQQVGHVGLLMVNISRGNFQLEQIRFEAANPSFVIFVTKPV